MQKCWQKDQLEAVWQLAPRGGLPVKKAYLILNANQAAFGAQLTAEKPANTTSQTALAALLRKHVSSGGMPEVYQHPETLDLWLLFYKSGSDLPAFYLRLQKSRPPELSLISAEREQLIRQSNKGTFTKRKKFADPLPDPAILTPITDSIWQLGEKGSVPFSANKKGTDPFSEVSKAQREVASRLRRRGKTLKKSLAKLEQDLPSSQEIQQLKDWALLLQNHAHRIPAEAIEMILTPEEARTELPVTIPLDPEKSPGQNINDTFAKAKRLERKLQQSSIHIEKLTRALTSIEGDVVRLRTDPVAEAGLATFLKKHGLKISTEAPAKKKSPAIAQPWRTFMVHGRRILVGKGPKENDELTKKARGSDYWLHAAGVTGSHVIVPAPKKGALTLEELRPAAILAIHYSKYKGDLAGEVYITKRSQLTKKKGSPAGLWQVGRSKTEFIRYKKEELDAIMQG